MYLYGYVSHPAAAASLYLMMIEPSEIAAFPTRNIKAWLGKEVLENYFDT